MRKPFTLRTKLSITDPQEIKMAIHGSHILSKSMVLSCSKQKDPRTFQTLIHSVIWPICCPNVLLLSTRQICLIASLNFSGCGCVQYTNLVVFTYQMVICPIYVCTIVEYSPFELYYLS